ncbi:MAG TPA: hypothetical protein VK674_07240 [Candidatus Limnocylindria bacterium]|nr:hypothetical protein [Candidatus Limnocylindria bacterium]
MEQNEELPEQGAAGVLDTQTPHDETEGPQGPFFDPAAILSEVVVQAVAHRGPWSGVPFRFQETNQNFVDNGVVTPTRETRVRAVVNAVRALAPDSVEAPPGSSSAAVRDKTAKFLAALVSVDGEPVPRPSLLDPALAIERTWQELKLQFDPVTQAFRDVAYTYQDRLTPLELDQLRMDLVLTTKGETLRTVYNEFVKRYRQQHVIIDLRETKGPDPSG